MKLKWHPIDTWPGEIGRRVMLRHKQYPEPIVGYYGDYNIEDDTGTVLGVDTGWLGGIFDRVLSPQPTEWAEIPEESGNDGEAAIIDAS